LHSLEPWACNAILQRNWVLATCQKMMEVTKYMEDDSMHKNVGMPLISQFTMKVNIENAMQATNGPKRG
jgi:hypothetical protein